MPHHTFAPGTAPAEVVALTKRLVPLLIAGDHPALATLREQWARTEVGDIDMTGQGFFANLVVPTDLPAAEPRHMTGGNANIELEGHEGAGCVLYVVDGYLRTLDVHAWRSGWPDPVRVLGISEVDPIPVEDARPPPAPRPPPFDGDVVLQGTWLYAGTVPSRILILRRDTFYGTGDHEDEPEVAENRQVETFEVLYSAGGEPDRFSASGGQHLGLDAARAAAEKVCGPSVRWNPPTSKSAG